ncbi:MAG: flavin reductase domain protein FMN-binding [Bryobacterales bacterium]|nr:flavin reductase domain protein FMN-binding [Bryobacterales bacterium]
MSSKALPVRPSNFDKSEFCRTCARFPTGVTVVTVLDREGSPHGMTASSFTSVSLEPPLVLVCVDHQANVLEHFRRSDYLAINVLDETQQELSVRFARRGEDRFDGVEWYAGQNGVPLIPGALASFECAIHRTMEAGDHTIFVAEVLGVSYREGRPLVFFGSGYRMLDGVNGV